MSDAGDLASSPLTAGRLEKHHPEAVPYRFERSDLAADLHSRFGDLERGGESGDRASVAGRVMLMRSFGKLVFATIQDVSGRIQLLADQARMEASEFDGFRDLDLGDWIGAEGEIVTTKKGELSVRLGSFVLLAKALRPPPEKWHGLSDVEERSRHRYVDLAVNPEARKVAIDRTRIVAEMRRQFAIRGFIEVETPVLLIEATGALARPFATHHSALDVDMYLHIALELHLKRLVVGGLERVFEVGRIFRNEGIDATHNPEFTMLEAYQALADYRDILQLVEEVFSAVATEVTGSTTITYKGESIDLTPPYRQASYMDLVSEAVGQDLGLALPSTTFEALAAANGIEVKPGWGNGRIAEALYDELVEPGLRQPTFVMDHPREISPLARRHRSDPDLVERFELVIAGSEYANAFSELTDPVEQRERFEDQAAARAMGDDEAHPVDEDYLRALEYGLPPTGGLGIGIDRLVMLLTDSHHIREVILFPTMRPEPRT
jgi:lysyl-tRNA synthetase class 2